MQTIEWYDLMREYFGVSLSVDRAALWIKLLKERDALPDLSTDELCNVLRWVRKQREGDANRKTPTLEMLIGWVKWYRKEHAINRTGYSVATSEGFVAMVWGQMQHSKGDCGRIWDIACAPHIIIGAPRDSTLQETATLLQLAEEHGLLPPGYVRKCDIPHCSICGGPVVESSDCPF